jgi:hypothetical protein
MKLVLNIKGSSNKLRVSNGYTSELNSGGIWFEFRRDTHQLSCVFFCYFLHSL